MRRIISALTLLCVTCTTASAQETASVNGVADVRPASFAFTNAVIVKDPQTKIENGTLLIRKGRIVAAGQNISIPADALVMDCKGKYIYPSFIDAYSDYGIAIPVRAGGAPNFFAAQLQTGTKGAYAANQAIRAEIAGHELFTGDESKAKTLREAGFGVVATHQKDGIARGTGTVVMLSGRNDNLAMLRERASANYSFSKGVSTQSYPNSMMGSIALLRQTFLDAQWYKTAPQTEGTNISLQSWTNNLSLPQIFEANDKWNCLRADRIGDEFGTQFIIKAGQNEYQRINEMKATNAKFILPLNFPAAIDAEDPNDIRFVALADLKQWEMAPSQPAAFEKAGIAFSITMADMRDQKQFWPNLRKSIELGLTEVAALTALTKAPADFLNIYNETGSLDAGKRANFFISNGPVFAEKTTILQHWIGGEKFIVKDDAADEAKGRYNLTVSGAAGTKSFSIEVKDNSAEMLSNTDTIAMKYNNDGKNIRLSFAETKRAKKGYRLSGISSGNVWRGTGTDSSGNPVLWSADYVAAATPKSDSAKKKPATIGILTYPNGAYGVASLLQPETMLIKNATVWTSESDGVLTNTDVLVSNGKISAIGKNLSGASARVIDGTGKFLTAGVIDEHSHIAVSSINEGGQSVTSEVRIADNLDPDDIDIYRQLGGGVTTSHILHGSANTIGGQTQLIKHRWGVTDTALKVVGANPFIKFALGENVKRTPSQTNNRFPDTRPGVEQVQMDAFTRALDYKNALKGSDAKNVRRDLELDALVEIMDKKRFITCHSYVQSEITEMMRVAEKFGFTVNTFTHILEGYKVADKMKAHGSNVSTFSDWWAYKLEVQDAIPYNAAIMNRAGLNVAINSDDPEMARRLNQEAAKTVRFGGMTEQQAWAMVTINPAKMMHVDKMIGSIKKGKDADLVLWSDNPLSIYARAEKTIVDGVLYYDIEKDAQMRRDIAIERNRIIQKLLEEKKGGDAAPARASMRRVNHCEEGEGDDGLLIDNTVEGAAQKN